jgi:putative glycosyltransferase (TIGR04372 family)
MHHLDIRIGQRRYLLCDPQTTPTGRAAGYGNLIRHIEQTIRAAGGLGAAVFLIKPAAPINAALYELESDEVRIIGQAEWAAPILRALWVVSTPFRYGRPLVWLASSVASLVRAPLEGGKHWTRRRGWRALDRWLDRAGHTSRRLAHSYETHVVDAWTSVYREARERARATGSKVRPVRVRLRPADEAAADALARAAGLDPARPIVTLHVREGGFRTRDAERQRDLDAIREADIETYAPVVAWLVARGYQVVRIGDSTMTPCRWPGVVDAATARWRTGAFELWALRRSRFFIASDSGPYFLSKLCGIPCVVMNVVQLGYYAAGDRDRYICKHVRDRQSGRRLSIAEMLTEEFLATALDRRRYEWVGNVPEDIVEAVEDQIALLDAPSAEARTPAQQRHDDLLATVSARGRGPRSATSLLFRRLARGTIAPRFAARYMDS